MKNNRRGGSEGLGLREPRNPAKTPHSLLTYYWLTIVMVGAPMARTVRALTTGAFAPNRREKHRETNIQWCRGIERVSHRNAIIVINLSLNNSNGQICSHVGGCRPQSSNSISQSLPQNTLPTNRMIDGEYCNFISSKLSVRIQMKTSY